MIESATRISSPSCSRRRASRWCRARPSASPFFPHLLRDLDRGARGGLPPHPALLRQFEATRCQSARMILRAAAIPPISLATLIAPAAAQERVSGRRRSGWRRQRRLVSSPRRRATSRPKASTLADGAPTHRRSTRWWRRSPPAPPTSASPPSPPRRLQPRRPGRRSRRSRRRRARSAAIEGAEVVATNGAYDRGLRKFGNLGRHPGRHRRQLGTAFALPARPDRPHQALRSYASIAVKPAAIARRHGSNAVAANGTVDAAILPAQYARDLAGRPTRPSWSAGIPELGRAADRARCSPPSTMIQTQARDGGRSSCAPIAAAPADYAERAAAPRPIRQARSPMQASQERRARRSSRAMSIPATRRA